MHVNPQPHPSLTSQLHPPSTSPISTSHLLPMPTIEHLFPTVPNIDHPSHPHLTHPMSTPLPCLTKTNPHVALLAPTINQPFPPLTSPIFPPAPNTDQPHHPASTPPSTSPISTPLPTSTYLQPPALASLYTSCSPPSHISMARTKQSARKVTGGHAPRVNLEELQKKKAKAKAASKKPPLKIQAKDNAVIICLDGGEMWIEESLQKVKKADIKFMCMTCHWQKTKNDPKPYMGFYSKGEPALSTPPIIPGGFHHAMTSQVAPHPTALLHLHLEGLAQDIGHSQVAMLHSFLQASFLKGITTSPSSLSFNLGTPESMDAYDKAASDLANTLSAYSRVVLFLTTHSDEDRGDLFTGYINKKPVAYKVLPLLQLLLKPLSKIINGADVIFYVCGSVVTSPQSFNGVKEVAQQSMLLFDAQHLQLASPTSKASWTTPSSKAFLFPVQLRLL
ncbi:hypothetical protein EDD16DRAFT_1521868 [Pisolithus croceorrhizus]|nr:hypothetical protein EDD16DRAFT_1521868 [Pisolithus croceorrhizus]